MKSIQLIEKTLNILQSNANINKRYSAIIKNFEGRKEQWSNNKIRIGVVGITSSGKSTLINSILGDNILSMAVKPSSSQLVSCSKSKEKLAKVYFENEKVLTLKGTSLNKKNIKKYSDENFNSNNKEKVVQLELATPKFELGDDVILIDSPGLDAYGLENHEALTLEVLLPTIDVCVFVTTLKNNSDEKMKSVLNLIAKYNCQVLIIQNMLDSLRPSIDGKKNIEDVAKEHRYRVQRIINESNIENKENVKIVQVSAIQALDARSYNRLTDIEKKNLLKKSNYKDFIFEVQEMIKRERPNIENQRIYSIISEVEKIISEGKDDINGDIKAEQLKFEFEGLDVEVNDKANKTQRKLYKYLEILSGNSLIKVEKNSLVSSISKTFGKTEDISEEDIMLIKEKVKRCETNIINTIADFNNYLRRVSKVLNIPPRDIISINGLPNMPELKIKTRVETERRRVERSGIFNGFKRKIGELFNKDWGYEYETVTVSVIDNAATKKDIIEYVNRAKKMYLKEVESWAKKTSIPIGNLINQINNRRDAFEERIENALGNERLLDVITKLEGLKKSVKIGEKIINAKRKKYKQNIHNDLKVQNFNKSAYNIAKISDRISNIINLNTNNILLKLNKKEENEWIIVGWDVLSMISFAKRFCDILLSEETVSILETEGRFSIEKYCFYFKPSEEVVKEFMDRKESKNIYILTNATQYGSAQNQISKSKICEKLLKNDFLSFVIQDFIEIINGQGVIEAIQNMILITRNLNINHEAFITINHSNPIFNIAISEAQINPTKIEKQETVLLNRLQKSFKYLRDENIDKILANIIRGASKKRSK